MEPPTKRQRLDDDPKASFLHTHTKLKSRFEEIFAKYEKDFTGVGDEIDINSGRIVVDNGHLLSLQDGGDPREAQVKHDWETEREFSSDEDILASSGKESHDAQPRARGLMKSTESPVALEKSSTPRSARSTMIQKSQTPSASGDDCELVLPTMYYDTNATKATILRTLFTLPSPKQRMASAAQSKPRMPSPVIDPKWQIPSVSAELFPHDVEFGETEEEPIDEELVETEEDLSSHLGVSIWALPEDKKPRARVKWTAEEKAQLRYFKVHTKMTYPQFQHHFPGRKPPDLAAMWAFIRKKEKIAAPEAVGAEETSISTSTNEVNDALAKNVLDASDAELGMTTGNQVSNSARSLAIQTVQQLIQQGQELNKRMDELLRRSRDGTLFAGPEALDPLLQLPYEIQSVPRELHRESPRDSWHYTQHHTIPVAEVTEGCHPLLVGRSCSLEATSKLFLEKPTTADAELTDTLSSSVEEPANAVARQEEECLSKDEPFANDVLYDDFEEVTIQPGIDRLPEEIYHAIGDSRLVHEGQHPEHDQECYITGTRSLQNFHIAIADPGAIDGGSPYIDIGSEGPTDSQTAGFNEKLQSFPVQKAPSGTSKNGMVRVVISRDRQRRISQHIKGWEVAEKPETTCQTEMAAQPAQEEQDMTPAISLQHSGGRVEMALDHLVEEDLSSNSVVLSSRPQDYEQSENNTVGLECSKDVSPDNRGSLSCAQSPVFEPALQNSNIIVSQKKTSSRDGRFSEQKDITQAPPEVVDAWTSLQAEEQTLTAEHCAIPLSHITPSRRKNQKRKLMRKSEVAPPQQP